MKHQDRVPLSAPPEDFRERLAGLSPEPLSLQALDALLAHAEELARWSSAVGLVLAASWDELLERHYGESLAGLELLSPSSSSLVDLGSGAGFPGFVLAAARQSLQATLVESRGRKWAFLRAVCRRARLSVNCLNVRVADSLPEGLPSHFDALSARAVRFPADTWRKLVERMNPGGQVLLWVGKEVPPLPEEFRIEESKPLPGSLHRRILRVTSDLAGKGCS